jgi:hypothetical protein
MRKVLVVLAALFCLQASAQDRLVRDLLLSRKISGDSTSAPSTPPAAGKNYVYYRGKTLGWKMMTPDGVETSFGSGYSSGGGGVPAYPHDTTYILRGDSAWAKIATATLGNGGWLVSKGDTAIVVKSMKLAEGGLDSSCIAASDTTMFGYLPWDCTIESVQFITNGTSSLTATVGYGTAGSLTRVVTAGNSITTKGLTSVTSLNNSTPSSGTYFGIFFSSITTKPERLTWYIVGKLRF